jgi:hypothetical protein
MDGLYCNTDDDICIRVQRDVVTVEFLFGVLIYIDLLA